MAKETTRSDIAPQFAMAAHSEGGTLLLSSEDLARARLIASSKNMNCDDFLRQELAAAVERHWADLPSRNKYRVDPETGWDIDALRLIKAVGITPMKKPDNRDEAENLVLDLFFVVTSKERGGNTERKARSMKARIIKKYSCSELTEPSP